MNMKKMNVTNRMYEAGALAIVRAETLDRACEIAEGCKIWRCTLRRCRNSSGRRNSTTRNPAWCCFYHCPEL